MAGKTQSLNSLLIDKELVSELRKIFPDISAVKRDTIYQIPEGQISAQLAKYLIATGVGDYNYDYEWNEFTEEHEVKSKDTFEFSGGQIRDIFERLDGNKARVRKETLEYVSRHFGELKTGTQIVGLLSKWGVPDSLIDYPNTKWWTVFGVLCYYASSPEKKDLDMFYKIVGEILHPLLYGGDKEKAEEACKNFNKYLEYDGLGVGYSQEDRGYSVYSLLTKEEEEEIMRESAEEDARQVDEERAFLQKPENKERISTLRKAYQSLTNIVEVFCENPAQPNSELNAAYLKAKELALRNYNHLSFNNPRTHRRLRHLHLPFENLFVAEKIYREQKKKLHWDSVRPEMFASYGGIEEVYRLASGSDILSEPDVQQTLNEVALLLSNTKEENRKNAEAKQKTFVSKAPNQIVHKVEITKMPRSGGVKKPSVSDRCWVTKSKDGTYRFEENIMHITNKDADYAKIFDVVFSLIPQGGEVAYDSIVTACQTRGLKTDKKAVQRALTGKDANFFRYVEIAQRPKYGIPLFEATPNGKKLKFNNASH